jgi:osmotically-inducible protein OsmY
MVRTDELIKKDVVDQLTWDDRIDASKIAVAVDKGTVTLKGEVPTYLSKSAAETEAMGVLGVTDVINQLIVRYPPSKPFATDGEIQKRIAAKLATDPDIDLLEMDVSVDAGVVTLKGTVDTYWKKIHAENLVAPEAGVVRIDNHIAVAPSEDLIGQEIAKDIVDSLERKTMIRADDVTVEVRGGNVTLMGTVPNAAARRAAYESALYTYGVINIEDRLTISGI